MPKVSVVIPTYRRPDSLKRLLDKLEHQTFKDFEVIVIVDGDRETFEALSDIKGKKPYPIKLEIIPNSGCNIARNRGIELAEGEIIAFTDDDCIPDDDWLENGVKYFRQPAWKDRISWRYRSCMESREIWKDPICQGCQSFSSSR